MNPLWLFYCNFVCDSFIRGDSRPTALLTKVEYVLSGPIEEGTNSAHSNLNILLAMKIQSSILSVNQNLHSIMKILWAHKNAGAKLLENVLKKFNNEVDITENRYQVKLLYKENHERLGNNFKYKQQLKNLTRNNIIKKIPSYHNLGKTHYLLHKPLVRHDKKQLQS